MIDPNKAARVAFEIHLLDAGHFGLDEKNDDIASRVLAFLTRHSV
jgi:hypothetical protein